MSLTINGWLKRVADDYLTGANPGFRMNGHRLHACKSCAVPALRALWPLLRGGRAETKYATVA